MVIEVAQVLFLYWIVLGSFIVWLIKADAALEQKLAENN